MSIIVFTDGSYMRQGDKCGYGVHFPNKEFKDISRSFTHLPKTNQRAELYAIYKAIYIINKKDQNLDILINSDSEYSIKSMSIWIKNWKKNNWISSTGKPVLNQDLIKKIDNLMEKHVGKIQFKHVRAHTSQQDYDSIHNDITDKLAKDGANII